MPGCGGEFEPEVSRILVVVSGIEKFREKEVVFVSKWLTSWRLRSFVAFLKVQYV